MGKENKELKDLNLLDKFLFDEAVAAPGFLEDVLFYSIRYLHEDLEKVNFQKNHAK